MKANIQLINKYLFLLVLGGVMIISCKKVLNPKPVGVTTLDVSFEDLSGAVKVTNSIYGTLSGTSLYKPGILSLDQASDDVFYNPKPAGANYSVIDYFEHNSSTPDVLDIWASLYQVIQRANIVISRGPDVPASLPNDVKLKEQLIAEAKFLRAFAYFNLVRTYGGIPLQTTEIRSVGDINKPRNTGVEVYQLIEQDLAAAIAVLPSKYPSSYGSSLYGGNEVGRATKWAATAVLADVFLTQKKYAEAKTAAASVIGNDGGFALNTNYNQNFLARGGTDNSKESLFEIQFGKTAADGPASQSSNRFSVFMGPTGNTISGLGTSNNGYRPSSNDGYLPPSGVQETGFTGGLYDAYETGDTRFTVNFTTGPADGGITRPLFFKFYQAGNASGNENFPIYRMADMYLIFAEASNEAAGPDVTSRQYVNDIRRRAFFGLTSGNNSKDIDVLANLTKASFRDIIRLERRREFAGEGKRWFDLVRYGFDYMKPLLVDNQKRNTFEQKHMLFPIPQSEVFTNPLMSQNTGY